jgi:hypothetical protein
MEVLHSNCVSFYKIPGRQTESASSTSAASRAIIHWCGSASANFSLVRATVYRYTSQPKWGEVQRLIPIAIEEEAGKLSKSAASHVNSPKDRGKLYKMDAWSYLIHSGLLMPLKPETELRLVSRRAGRGSRGAEHQLQNRFYLSQLDGFQATEKRKASYEV